MTDWMMTGLIPWEAAVTQDLTLDHSTDGMVDYNANSFAQRQNALRNAHVIADLARRVSVLPGPLNITDYGCGPGDSSVDTVRPALNVWQTAAAGRMKSVCHADQHGNDWNALMALVFSDHGYAKGHPDLLIHTAVGSFYDRMVPDRSVSLATCFFASHWLNHSVHLNAPETIWFGDLAGEARRQMWQQAETDWVRLLQLRAPELQSGGYLFISTLGAVPAAGEPNGVAASGRGLYRALQLITSNMTSDGLLDRKAADTFLFGFWFMTEAEARNALETHDELAGAYEIDTLEVLPLDYGGDLFSAFLDDPADYARRYTGYTHAFASTTLRVQLFEPSANGNWSVERLETEFFRRLEDILREKTSEYAYEQWILNVILRRK